MDAKKKRNKKKKPNQSNTVSTAQEPLAQEEEHAADPNQNGKLLVSSQGPPLPVPDHHHDEDTEKQLPLQNGASLLDKEKQPPSDNALPGLTEPEPHQGITDQNSCQPKLLHLHEMITKLQEESNSPSEKVTTLEDRLSKMQHKVDSYVQNEFLLGRKLQILQNENDILAKKQVSLEDKFERMDDMKYSWSLKEGSLNSTITCLEEANRTLQMRVKALEQSTYNTDQENRKLIETLSLVESRIEALEAKSIQGSLSADAAKMMKEKSEMMITQSADKETNQHISHFVDPLKSVNELEIKQNETNKDLAKSDLSQERCLNVSPPTVETIQKDSETLPPTIQAMQYPSTVPVANDLSDDTTITVDIDQVQKLELHLPSLSEENAHPLQDVEINEEEVSFNDERMGAVPLSDAPLIGAPFRLFSFMAKYVAGSDLVDQTSSKSGN